MERMTSGDHHAFYKIGDLTLTSLRDGYADMVTTLFLDGAGSLGR